MRTFRAPKPSPSLIVSIIALVVALGGTSYAALSVPRNSVGSQQLKDNAVSAPKIRDGAVTGAKIDRNAITAAQINFAKVGTVPSANTANTAAQATNATNLGGSPASAYQQKILWARVAPDGTLTAGSGAMSAGQLATAGGQPATGEYEVTFNQPVTGCAYEATIGSSLENNSNNVNDNGPGQIFTEPRNGNPNGVFVETLPPAPVYNSTTKTWGGANNAFHLVVIC